MIQNLQLAEKNFKIAIRSVFRVLNKSWTDRESHFRKEMEIIKRMNVKSRMEKYKMKIKVKK